MWITNAQGRFTVRLAYFLQQGMMSRIEISQEEAMEFENTMENNLENFSWDHYYLLQANQDLKFKVVFQYHQDLLLLKFYKFFLLLDNAIGLID